MQVNVVDGGRQAFNTMLYNVPDNSTIQWLNNNINKAREVLTGIADNLVETTANLYNKVNSSAAVNAAKSLINSQGGNSSNFAIYSIDQTGMGEANYIMQQYIMANPVVQELYRNNMCNGYESTYYNEELDVHGKDRLDYQRVMDGVLTTDNEGRAVVYHYSNSDSVEIPVYDQFSILETWEQAENMILNNIDPTDPDGNDLE